MDGQNGAALLYTCVKAQPFRKSERGCSERFPQNVEEEKGGLYNISACFTWI